MSGGDWKDMFAAACRGDVELVRFHVEAGVDVNYAHPEFQGADPTLISVADQLTPLAAAKQSALPALEHRHTLLGAG